MKQNLRDFITIQMCVSFMRSLCPLPGWKIESEALSSDVQVHQDGFRASDKGFLPVSLCEYLRLLRWTAKQAVDGMVLKVPESLSVTITQPGIEASMWRDLVWHW